MSQAQPGTEALSQVWRFSPHPEAQPLDWVHLQPPVRRAVAALLTRLHGSISSQREAPRDGAPSPVHAGTIQSFLVYGARGTGKTTVLLSARKAVRRPADFFHAEGAHQGDGTTPDPGREAAHEAAEYLHGRGGVIWLDILDLEPLPPGANLLTAMLTRVRDALGVPRARDGARLTECYEEAENTARKKLTRLINHAALLWENIEEPDTRSRANREVAAAERYGTFLADLTDAMDTLSRELRNRRDDGERTHVILPIDNVDRSTEHLKRIVKLAQMVACPGLWIVMAGDRQDIDIFLERAYWKELISVGNAAGARDKPGIGQEDESFVMARRQAAAALHKLLPPSHRMELDPMRPSETLDYRPEAERLTVRDLMGRIDPGEKWLGPLRMKLSHFFLKRRYVSELEPQMSDEKAERLSRSDSAQRALTLPVRSVIDLWNLMHWVAHGDGARPQGRESPIEKVPRIMLGNVLSESGMGSVMGRRLQEQIIRRRFDGATLINWRAPNPRLCVEQLSMNRLRVHYQSGGAASEAVLYSTVLVNESRGLSLSIAEPDAEAPGADNILPDVVAGWLAILQDSVLWSERSAVMLSADRLANQLVQVAHQTARISDACSEGEGGSVHRLWWPAPAWVSFLAHDVFTLKWQIFLGRIQCEPRDDSRGPDPDRLLRLLAMAWIRCAVDTFRELFPPPPRKPAPSVPACLDPEQMDRAALDAFAGDAMAQASDLYGDLGGGRQVIAARHGHGFMKDWLELQLPLLLSALFVPLEEPARTQHRDAFLGGAGEQLRGAWGAHRIRILEAENRHILPIVCPLLGAAPARDPALGERAAMGRAAFLESVRSREPFGYLHDVLQP